MAAVPAAAVDNAPRRPFPHVQLLALLGVLLLFGGVVAEIGLRLASRDVDPRCAAGLSNPRQVFQVDPDAGYVMRPNLCLRLRSAEYDEVLRTNNRGLVGPDLPANKPAGELRVVVLGDSYTAAGQVPYEASYTTLLEQQLRAAGYPNVRVVNAGAGGWSTVNQAGFLRANVGWLQPDVVVVATYVGNDPVENIFGTVDGYRDAPEHPNGVTWGDEAAALIVTSVQWFPRNGVPPPAGRIRVLRADDPLPEKAGNPPPRTGRAAQPPLVPVWVWDPSPLNTARNLVRWSWDAVRSNSRVLGRLFGVPAGAAGSEFTTAPGFNPPAREQQKLNVSSFEWTILREPPEAYWLQAAWPLYGKYLGEIRDTAASVGAPTLVMLIPQMGQFDDQMRARSMNDFRFQESEVDWDRPQREATAQAARQGLPVLDLLPVFRAHPQREALYLRGDTHFAALGHQVTAEGLAETLLSRGMVR